MLAGDGIKICKEAEKMPAVKRLHQESDNSGKALYIYGHHWGVIGILAGWIKKLLCIPLCAELHEGVADIRRLQNKADPVINDDGKQSKYFQTAQYSRMLAFQVGSYFGQAGQDYRNAGINDSFEVGTSAELNRWPHQ